MKFLDRLLSKQPTEFATALVERIVRQFPPTSEAQLTKKGAQRRLEAVVQQIINDVAGFQESTHLGWFGKARLGNRFRWQLLDRGYSKQFADALTDGIIRHIASTK
jgi:hypothetical protein